MKLRFLGALALMIAVLPGFANAAYVLQFGQGGVAGITDFQASVGSTIDIELYLTQTEGDTDLTDDGIWTMAFDFRIDGAGGLTHESIADESTYVFPAGFPDNRVTTLSNNFQDLQVDANGDFSNPVFPEAGSNSIFLGTASLLVNGQGVYNLEIEQLSDLSFTLGDSINGLGTDPGAATLTAVPEPGSFAVLGLCAGSGAFVRWRRRRQAASAV